MLATDLHNRNKQSNRHTERKNSSKYDEIYKKNHKNKQSFIISPSRNKCNKMLPQGMYPEILKFSLMKPIYESGDKSSPFNYRLIACIFKNFRKGHIPKIV